MPLETGYESTMGGYPSALSDADQDFGFEAMHLRTTSLPGLPILRIGVPFLNFLRTVPRRINSSPLFRDADDVQDDRW